jgi:endogenous inhibitor of DNA gyrase (YacG/DUF329 family)
MTQAARTPSPRTVRCPGCGGPSVYAPENIHRPFCSARCKGTDLGAWASERYRVESGPPASPDDASDDGGPLT